MQTGSAFCEIRASWLLVVGWIVAVAQQTAAADRTNKATSADKPNILFIMVDEMKWNVMSCAGHAIVRTPNLDRLAQPPRRLQPL